MNAVIKISTSLIFFFLLQLTLAYGQDNSSNNSLESGSKALQFQISENFNLSSFDGSTISYKRQLSEDRARRVGLFFDNFIANSDSPDSEQESESEGLRSNVGVNYTWMNYTDPEADIKFYYGYGPGINIGYDKTVNEDTILKDTRQFFSFGIAGIGYAGVEWFFHSSMSLHAEYRASVRVSTSRFKRTTVVNSNEDISKRNSTRIDLGGDGVKFGLSVYF